MASRKIAQELAKFLRREVKEKSAEWGELYKLKRLTSVKTGLPNLPKLTILGEPWLSYIIAVKSGSEVRLYYYNQKGVLEHGDTFRNEETQILDNIQKKSKRLYRYPTKKKTESIVDITKEYDLKFRATWKKIAQIHNIPKKQQRSRPVIKVVTTEYSGIFNTKSEGFFIYIPLNSHNLQHIFVFYSFYFLLPSPIRKNHIISENIALRLYDSFMGYDSIIPKLKALIGETIDCLGEWSGFSTHEILFFLNRLCLYNTEKWETSDFNALRSLYKGKIPKVTRNDLHEVYCKISAITGNQFLSFLASLLSFPLEMKCSPSNLKEYEYSRIYLSIQRGRLTHIHNYLKENHLILTQGLQKAIREVLQFWYANVLEISSEGHDPLSYQIKNKSDLTIVLDMAYLVSSSGSKTVLDSQKNILLPDSETDISFSFCARELESIISIEYHIIENERNMDKTIFTGKIRL